MKKFISKLIKKWKQKRIVKKINKALSISLYDWQIEYIFNDGIYHSEFLYGRCNGKTLANVLKLLFSEGGIILINPKTNQFHRKWIYTFAQEDAATELRKKFFVNEVLKTYKLLFNIKGIKLRKIEEFCL